MARATSETSGWFASLLGAAVLIAGGFLVGLVAGVVTEEPDLVVDHLAGHSEEVAWNAQIESGQDGSPSIPATVDGGTPLGGRTEATSPPAAPVSAPPPQRTVAAAKAPSAPSPRPRTGPAASARAVDPRSGFAVQVGAFSDSDGADRLAQELRAAGFHSYVTAGAGDGRWRVRVGPVPERAEAETLAGRLKGERGLPTWILDEGTN